MRGCVDGIDLDPAPGKKWLKYICRAVYGSGENLESGWMSVTRPDPTGECENLLTRHDPTRPVRCRKLADPTSGSGHGL